MSVHRIAHRYAKPLLELAEEHKVLKAVHTDMADFAKLCADNREFLLMLKSPVIPHLKKGEILHKIFDGKVNKLTLAIFDIITRKNREIYLAEIADEFVLLYKQKMGMLDCTVTTTFPLDSKLRSSFQKMVKDVTGKEAILTEEVDKDILGGYVLRMGDRQLDASVSAALKEIKLKFNKK